MANTPNLGITLLEASQAQKEVTINEAFACLDALVFGDVFDKDLSTPPSSPASGATYIVGVSPTGTWTGKANHIAYYSQGWHFVAPQVNMRVFVRDEALYYQYSGSAWASVAWYFDRAGVGAGTTGSAAKLTVYGTSGEGTPGQTIRLGETSSLDYSIRRNVGTGALEFQGSQTGSVGYNFLDGGIVNEQNALGTAVTNGVSLRNTTAAAVGSQQVSPAIRWSGNGWKTVTGGASQAVDWQAYTLPVQGSSAPSAQWILQSSINGGAYSTAMSVDSNGLATFGGGLNSGGSLATGSSTSANLYIPSSTSAASTNHANWIFAGASNISFRIGHRGSTVSTIPLNNSYSTVVLGQYAVNEASSGIHSLIAGYAMRGITINDAGAATTNTATLYIEGPASGITPTNAHYALWADAGTSRFDGNVIIGASDGGDATAALQVDSTTQGVLLPRMTTTQKNAIASPTEGLSVYDTTLHALSTYNGTVWVQAGSGGVDTTAWTSYTPAITAQAGSFSSVSATGAYKQIGKTVFVRITATVTSMGSAAGTLRATLPVNAEGVGYVLTGRENGTTGKMLQAYTTAADNVLSILYYDNTSPIASGNVLYINGSFQAA